MVKRVSVVSVGLVILTASVAGNTGTNDCSMVTDPDLRNYCRATLGHDKTYCEFIRRPDLRQACRAGLTPAPPKNGAETP